MSPNPYVCVFLGDRNDAARNTSRLRASGIQAKYVEDPLDRLLEAMGGSQLAKVLVAREDLDRATTVLGQLDFR